MNLQQTISKITGLIVNEEDAMVYSRDNFDNLVSHLRSDLWETMREQESRIKELKTEIKELEEIREEQTKNLNTAKNTIEFVRTLNKALQTESQQYREALSNMVVFHEYNASYDKGNNGYYAAKRLLNK